MKKVYVDVLEYTTHCPHCGDNNDMSGSWDEFPITIECNSCNKKYIVDYNRMRL